jgi:hypothetical protein
MGYFSDTPSNPVGGGGQYSNKREVPRFYAHRGTAVLREPESDTKIAGRISELSRKGCYVDTLIALPEGTNLEVHVSRDQGVFESHGKIIYVQSGMGMGARFCGRARRATQDTRLLVDGTFRIVAARCRSQVFRFGRYTSCAHSYRISYS